MSETFNAAIGDEQINQVPPTTPNFTTEAAAKLAEMFPEAVSDGKIDLDVLETLIDEDAAGGGVSVLA